ncbi:sugar ABC transporter substrate-binding protein [Sphaerisporangium rubeum]|uniref:Multiple sugar transport system substrate-binding protein n=1 Tax=Sphaerisporangium rubeum TaxID=321317 RepID=A0A7X0I9S4_9ACTN|nr:sugar ABC transporter substrate-binding protein [Sphaerisporangium rubeum]MBB6471262.1 multiple sugar transport system substrate-binding protein [Sphaerisporangium rubeum]
MRLHRVRRSMVAAVGATCMAAALLTGCGSDSEPEGASAGSSGGGVTKLTFAASTLGDPGRGPSLTKWLEEFNSSQTAIQVAPAAVPYPTFGQTILTQMGSGQGPDLIRFDMPEFAAASDAGLIAPLDDLVDVSKYDLLKQPDQFMVHDGTRHGIIFEASNYAMFYNADLIKTPPKTYEEFVETAKKLTKGDTYGLAFRQTEAEEAGVWQDIFNYVYGFGGAWSDGQKLTINSPENLKGLQAYKDLYDAKVIPRGADAATFRRMFAEGKVGMELNNGGYVTATRGQNADLNFSVAPIPFPVRKQGTILAPIVINEASPAKEAAATFIKWALEPDNQVKLQEILGASSVATTTTRSPEQLDKTPFLTVFDELTETSLPHVVQGFEAKTPDIRKVVVQNVIAALQGTTDLKAAMDRAQQQATDVVG